jgi:hypothetical protein
MVKKQEQPHGDGNFISPHYVKVHDLPINKIARVKRNDDDREIQTIMEVLDECYETWVKIYGDRMRGWFIDHAKRLDKDGDAGYIVLMICVAYLEASEQYLQGRRPNAGESSTFVRNALIRVTNIKKPEKPLVKKAINMFVSHVRAGLFHDSMTRRNISIGRHYIGAISISDTEDPALLINPSILLKAVEKDLEKYLGLLIDKKNKNYRKLSENFEKQWKLNLV